MATKRNPIGKVIKGDYQGCNIYQLGKFDYGNMNFHPEPFKIISGDNGFIQIGGMFPTIGYTIEKTLDAKSVESYKQVSSSDNGADIGSVTKGTLLFGAAGGILGGMTNRNTSHTIAIYFKDGKKSLIQMKEDRNIEDLLNDLFEF